MSETNGKVSAAMTAPQNGVKWIVAGIVCIFIGLFLYFINVLVTMVLLADPKRQVLAPGDAEVYFAEAGTYTIFHEYRSVFDGERYVGSPAAEGLRVRMTEKATGEEAALKPVAPTAKYASRGGKGESLYEAAIGAPGSYRVESWYDEGAPDQKETVLAIRRWNTARGPLMLLRSWGILAIPLAAGGYMIFRGVTLNRKAAA